MNRFIVLFLMLFMVGGCCGEKRDWMVMGVEQAMRRVVLLDVEDDWGDAGAVRWSWRPEDSRVVLEGDRKWFDALTDVKALDYRGEKCLMLSASGGVVAVVRVPDKKVLFYAYTAANTHSVEALPGGWIVGACSTGKTLCLMRIDDFEKGARGVKKQFYELKGAHGVVWDELSDRLWAVGDDVLRRYAFVDGELEIDGEWVLPSGGGHDLSTEPAGRGLYITCNKDVLRFDRDIFEFGAIAGLEGVERVKSLHRVEADGGYLMMVAEESWWSDRVVIYKNGERVYKRLEGARFYKARWWDGYGIKE